MAVIGWCVDWGAGWPHVVSVTCLGLCGDGWVFLSLSPSQPIPRQVSLGFLPWHPQGSKRAREEAARPLEVKALQSHNVCPQLAANHRTGSAHIKGRETSSTLRRRVAKSVYRDVCSQEWEELMKPFLQTIYQRGSTLILSICLQKKYLEFICAFKSRTC